jgi:hypothetical protein
VFTSARPLAADPDTSPLAVAVAEPAAAAMFTSPLAVRAWISAARVIRMSPDSTDVRQRPGFLGADVARGGHGLEVAGDGGRRDVAAGRVRVQFGQLSGAGDVAGRGAHRAP